MEDSTIKDALTTLADLVSKKEYEQAEKFWLNQSNTHGDYSYWHNLGVVYKLQYKYPHARFAFEKANHHTLYSVNTENELDSILEKLAINQSSTNGLNPAEWTASLGPYKVGAVCVLLSALALVFLKKKSSALQKSVVFIFSFLPLMIGYAYFQSTIAFVAIDQIPIYTGASQIYANGQFVSVGSRLIGQVKGDWIALRSQAGDVLWVKAADLKNQAMILWE